MFGGGGIRWLIGTVLVICRLLKIQQGEKVSYPQSFSKRILAFAYLLFLAGSLQAAISKVPPEVLMQLKSMSPSEQRELARQYGLDVSDLLGLPQIDEDFRERPLLGAPGEPLLQVLPESDSEASDQEGLDDQDLSERLSRFGANLFDSEVSTFAPVDNIPVPEGYRLGIGDELRVLLIGKEQGDFPLLIDRDGSVTLPKLGRVVLSGLSFPEAKTLIEKRVNERLIGSEAILSMGSLRSINVFIAGEVKKPGNYSISALSTLSQAVYIAGGISDIGSFREVQLKRKGKISQIFDIYDLLLFGDNSSDTRLQNGDVVFVPVAGTQASVEGAVVRPAIYELKMGDTMRDLLSMAGGLSSTANPQQAVLKRYRVEASLPSIENLKLDKTSSLEERVIDGDFLTIPSKADRVSNPIVIEGDTELEGVFGWATGMRINDIFQDLDGDVRPSADLNLSLIVRRKNDLNEIEVLPFSLSGAILEPSSEDNIELNPFDRILVLPNSAATEEVIAGFNPDDVKLEELYESEPLGNTPNRRRDLLEPIVEQLERQTRSGERAQVVTVSGAVREPGIYPLIGDGLISDVVALAGGYTDAAYLERVEIRRILLSEMQEAQVEILNVNLSRNSGSSFNLMGRDTLQINTIPNWSTEDTVVLSGEFVFPGTYTIFEGETIASLIVRAGGFTNEAFLGGAQYFSATARASQSQQLQRISASVRRRLESRRSIGDELSAANSGEPPVEAIDENLLGRVVVDLMGIANGSQEANVIVENGDTLFVPKFSNTIAVVGEVYEPGTFRFENGLTLDDYMEIAGGATTFALKKNTYLLKADGSVRFYRPSAIRKLVRFEGRQIDAIEAGDAIVVPTNLDYDPPIERINSVTNVVFQSLTSIAAFLSIARQ